jgi:hypothetical protein
VTARILEGNPRSSSADYNCNMRCKAQAFNVSMWHKVRSFLFRGQQPSLLAINPLFELFEQITLLLHVARRSPQRDEAVPIFLCVRLL